MTDDRKKHRWRRRTNQTVVQEKRRKRSLAGDWRGKAKVVKESNKPTDKATTSSGEEESDHRAGQTWAEHVRHFKLFDGFTDRLIFNISLNKEEMF